MRRKTISAHHHFCCFCISVQAAPKHDRTIDDEDHLVVICWFGIADQTSMGTCSARKRITVHTGMICYLYTSGWYTFEWFHTYPYQTYITFQLTWSSTDTAEDQNRSPLLSHKIHWASLPEMHPLGCWWYHRLQGLHLRTTSPHKSWCTAPEWLSFVPKIPPEGLQGTGGLKISRRVKNSQKMVKQAIQAFAYPAKHTDISSDHFSSEEESRINGQISTNVRLS